MEPVRRSGYRYHSPVRGPGPRFYTGQSGCDWDDVPNEQFARQWTPHLDVDPPNIKSMGPEEAAAHKQKLFAFMKGKERPLAEAPLALVCSNPGWIKAIDDEPRRSWAGYMSNEGEKVFSSKTCLKWFKDLSKSLSFQGQGTYKTAWYTSEDCECSYRYGHAAVSAQDFPDWLLEITEEVCKKCGLGDPMRIPNGCNINYYPSGHSTVPWHADNEPLFESLQRDCLILSLSLGATRKFEWKMMKELYTPSDGLHGYIHLADGDIMTMEGKFQKYYQHQVPKEHLCHGSRINLTWRWIVAHSKKDRCFIKEMYHSSPPAAELAKKWGKYCRRPPLSDDAPRFKVTKKGGLLVSREADPKSQTLRMLPYGTTIAVTNREEIPHPSGKVRKRAETITTDNRSSGWVDSESSTGVVYLQSVPGPRFRQGMEIKTPRGIGVVKRFIPSKWAGGGSVMVQFYEQQADGMCEGTVPERLCEPLKEEPKKPPAALKPLMPPKAPVTPAQPAVGFVREAVKK